jgi:hypothetical protein
MPTAKPLSLAELLSLLPRIQATLELLVGTAGNSARPADRPQRGRRAQSELPAQLLATLKQSKTGYSLKELQQKVGADRGAIKYHLRALRARKKARVKGNRRSARWMAA